MIFFQPFTLINILLYEQRFGSALSLTFNIICMVLPRASSGIRMRVLSVLGLSNSKFPL